MLKTSPGEPSGARPASLDTTNTALTEAASDDGGAHQAAVASDAVVVVAPSDHWSGQVVEAIVSVGSEGGITVLGGSDNGEFPYLGEISQGVRYQKGGPSLAPGAILLEVQGQRIAGYTQRDVVAWINHCTRNGNPCVIRTAPPGLDKRTRSHPSVIIWLMGPELLQH
ncbi:membrane-associated guanylate kinase, WW and PDZ domain-containing protein 1 isoform X3 [Cherax quadricarinatus]|uniref:membrane-associated guanylate kinase, WW and PDZ domain-containing protein 1 isoform X3 n=1 Tax=Cherax quadricarinatus TaxID=27406 RepID=UPI00387EB86D